MSRVTFVLRSYTPEGNLIREMMFEKEQAASMRFCEELLDEKVDKVEITRMEVVNRFSKKEFDIEKHRLSGLPDDWEAQEEAQAIKQDIESLVDADVQDYRDNRTGYHDN